jgi:hypothetical protein
MKRNFPLDRWISNPSSSALRNTRSPCRNGGWRAIPCPLHFRVPQTNQQHSKLKTVSKALVYSASSSASDLNAYTFYFQYKMKIKIAIPKTLLNTQGSSSVKLPTNSMTYLQRYFRQTIRILLDNVDCLKYICYTQGFGTMSNTVFV